LFDKGGEDFCEHRDASGLQPGHLNPSAYIFLPHRFNT